MCMWLASWLGCVAWWVVVAVFGVWRCFGCLQMDFTHCGFGRGCFGGWFGDWFGVRWIVAGLYGGVGGVLVCGGGLGSSNCWLV